MKNQLIADRYLKTPAQFDRHTASAHLRHILGSFKYLIDHRYHGVFVHGHIRQGRAFHFANGSFEEKSGVD